MAIDIEHYKKTGIKRALPSSCGSSVSIITDQQVIEIYERVRNGEGVRTLAKEYGITHTCISHYINGHRRKDVTGGSIYDE